MIIFRKVIIIILLSVPIILNANSTSETITVDPNGEIKSIQKAIDIAQDGDIINVMPGNYKINASTNKSLRIVGKEGKVYFEPEDKGSPVLTLVSSNNFEVEGISFSGDRSLVYCLFSNISLAKCRFNTSGTAVMMSGGTLYLNDNEFNGVKERTKKGYTYAGIALSISSAENIKLLNNSIKHMALGLSISKVDSLKCINNEFSQNVISISLITMDEVRLSKNDFIDNHIAIILSGEGNYYIANNGFIESTKWDLSLSKENCLFCMNCSYDPFVGTLSGEGNISDTLNFCPDDSSEIISLFKYKN